PPTHGYPLRVVVPGWYGMTHVKWLRSITVADGPFTGWQQDVAYRLRQSDEEQGDPVTRMLPRPIAPGRQVREGRAWSGQGEITRVEVSADCGRTWADATPGSAPSPYAWRG